MRRAAWSGLMAVMWIASCAMALSDDAGGRPVSGAVDKGWVHGPPLPAGTPVVVRAFGTENTDLGSGEDPKNEKKHEVASIMRDSSPTLLQSAMVNHLKDAGVLTSVTAAGAEAAPAGTAVVEGEFTLLNPGSRGARYGLGMGAGKSKVCVKGRVLGPDGAVLLSFEHCRVGTGGWFGGKSEGMMATDVSRTGYKVADFITEWARGAFAGR